jgi:hypothetical protein
MAIQLIESTDTLETGFRVKANANFNEIIESVTQVKISGNPTGTYRLNKNGGGFIDLVLTDQFYTISQISTLLSGISASPYSGAWDNTKTPYVPPAVVDHDGKLWRANTSTIAEPGTDGTWTDILSNTGGNVINVNPIIIGSAYPLFLSHTDYLSMDHNAELLFYTPQLDNTGAVIPNTLQKRTDLYEVKTYADLSDPGTFTGWWVYGPTNDLSTTSETMYITIKK